jgi:hypothetical protein
MLFHIFLKLGEALNKKENLFLFSLLAAVLWILHPLHTECVTNIKGRDEILVLMGSLAALWSSMKYEENQKSIMAHSVGDSVIFRTTCKRKRLDFCRNYSSYYMVLS